MTPSEIETSIIDLLDGTCEGDELRALEKELTSNPHARELYKCHVRIGAILALHAEDEGNAVHQVVPIDLLMARQRRKMLRISAIATFAAMLVLAGVLMVVTAPPPQPASFSSAPGSQFTLTHSDSDHEKFSSDQILLIGSRLEVHRGTIEIELPSGVTGILRAPTIATLIAEDRIDLKQSVALFTVPSEAIGFQVSTEEFLLTDLGTTFGVISNQNTADEVHVFKGLVEVQRHAADKDKDKITLKAGEARICSSEGGWNQLPIKESAFLTELPTNRPPPPYIHMGFDEQNGDTFYADGTSEAAKAINAQRSFTGEGPVSSEGVHGNSLVFDKSRDSLTTKWQGITGSQPRAVAMWVRIPAQTGGTEYNSTLLTWGKQEGGSLNDSWSLRASTRDAEISHPGQPDLKERTLFQLRLGATWINGTTDLADNRWHHIAACYDGNISLEGEPEVTLYVDGVRERTHIRHHPRPPNHEKAWPPTLRTDTSSHDSNPLLIGRSKTRAEVSCDAQIDELYIFEGNINSSLVKQLATAEPGWRP